MLILKNKIKLKNKQTNKQNKKTQNKKNAKYIPQTFEPVFFSGTHGCNDWLFTGKPTCYLIMYFHHQRRYETIILF